MLRIRSCLSTVVLVLALAGVAADEPAGTQSRTFDVAGANKLEFRITFSAGGKAEVWVHSERNTDVDLYIYDADNQLVAHDVSTSKDCYVSFTPTRQQVYRLRVVNLGRDSNTCTLKHTSAGTQ